MVGIEELKPKEVREYVKKNTLVGGLEYLVWIKEAPYQTLLAGLEELYNKFKNDMKKG